MTDHVDFVEVGEDFLAHFGKKGMKWGVRSNKDGTGTLSVKFRPTYTTEEVRAAAKNVKASKKTGKLPKDSSGASQIRIAKQRTVARRLVNWQLGTKISNTAGVAGALAVAALTIPTLPVTGPLATAGVVTAGIAGGAGLSAIGSLHATYKTFFSNIKNNPTVRLKTPLSANDMANYAVGKTITKNIIGKRGSAKLSVSKTSSKIIVKDQEGRVLKD